MTAPIVIACPDGAPHQWILVYRAGSPLPHHHDHIDRDPVFEPEVAQPLLRPRGAEVPA